MRLPPICGRAASTLTMLECRRLVAAGRDAAAVRSDHRRHAAAIIQGWMYHGNLAGRLGSLVFAPGRPGADCSGTCAPPIWTKRAMAADPWKQAVVASAGRRRRQFGGGRLTFICERGFRPRTVRGDRQRHRHQKFRPDPAVRKQRAWRARYSRRRGRRHSRRARRPMKDQALFSKRWRRCLGARRHGRQRHARACRCRRMSARSAFATTSSAVGRARTSSPRLRPSAKAFPTRSPRA